MRLKHLTLLACLALPVGAEAGVKEAVEGHILPGVAEFSDKAQSLGAVASEACEGPALEAAYNEAFDAWLGVSHLVFGPVEDLDLTLSFAFWPDPKNQTGKALGRLISAEDPVIEFPIEYAQVSVAAQGFFALERMIYDPPGTGAYACALVAAIAGNLANNAQLVNAGWQDFAFVVTEPGPDNPRFKSEAEAQRALYTSLSTGLEFIHDQRLARPLGTFDRPRPTRAEARRSGRSLRNVEVSLLALKDLASKFSDAPTPRLDAAYAKAFERVAAIDTPDFSGVSNPGQRLRIEALQVDVKEVQIETIEEIGAPMGLSAGFNALDGD
ncbi:MAG: imelysin family protein [Pseudomonadota bacterium]